MKFYLIDDNSESVFEIVNTVCCNLWKKMDDLEFVVVFFGDDYKRIPTAQDPTAEDISKIEDDINEKFRELCFAIDRDEWNPLGTAYKKKKENTTIKCQHIPLQQKEIENLLRVWREIEKPEKDSGQETDYSILNENALPEELVKRVGIQHGDLIALDICLLYDDYKRCTKELPVLSMVLHHYLKFQCECKCFLYSRMSVNTTAKSNWMNIYKEHFRTDPPEIHSRFNLGADVSPDYQELERLLTAKGDYTDES